MVIDLNSDLGESFGRWTLGNDAELMKSITSANVACGYHAGDPGVMRETVRLARDAGVAVGAHPGLPDLAGFGRRNMAVTPKKSRTWCSTRSARSRRSPPRKACACST